MALSIDLSRLKLVAPSESYADALLAMADEYGEAGETRYAEIPELAQRDVPAYVARLRRRSTVPENPGEAPVSSFWLVDDERIYAAARLRHHLTPALERWGGHIGYDVRPTARRQGIGSHLLSLMLVEARSRGIERIVLTCWSDNIGSIGVMRRNGAILDASYDRDGRSVSRFTVG